MKKRCVPHNFRQSGVGLVTPDYLMLSGANGKTVGYCTHAFFSLQVKRNIAHAYVEPGLATPGTKPSVALNNGAGSKAAEVVETPFYDPRRNR